MVGDVYFCAVICTKHGYDAATSKPVGPDAVLLELAEVVEQHGGLLRQLVEQLGQAPSVVFVVMVDGVAKFSDELPVFGRVEYV